MSDIDRWQRVFLGAIDGAETRYLLPVLGKHAAP